MITDFDRKQNMKKLKKSNPAILWKIKIGMVIEYATWNKFITMDNALHRNKWSIQELKEYMKTKEQ